MKTIYASVLSTLKEMESPSNGSWISLVNPSDEESTEIANTYGIDINDLRAPLDTEERSRVQVEEGYTLVLVDIPTTERRNDKDWYITIPLGIIITHDAIITTCLEETPLLKDFAAGHVRDFHTFMKTRFTFQLLFRNASQYLQYLRQIDRQTDEVELSLHRSTRNEELIELLELEKSLVYFSTSLRSNERVLEKLIKTAEVKKYPEDDTLLEDTIVENQQAMEMANIYTDVLAGTMDAFASVIANNQNVIMKLLALITIIMAIPTMIFSAYGMNVSANGMPLSGSPWGFIIIIAVAFAISAATIIIFRRKKYF